MTLKHLLRRLHRALQELRLPALKHRLRIYKKTKRIRQLTTERGGLEARTLARRRRQEDIRRQKAVIAEGLLRSWSLQEIRRPGPEIIFELRFFHGRKTLRELQRLEREAWS
jgi:hypothetical protein